MALDRSPASAEIAQNHGEDSLKDSVIDFSELDGDQHDLVLEKIIEAAKTFGFLQVVNHGLSIEFLDKLKDLVHQFFEQPEAEKAVYLKDVSPTPLVTYFPCTESMDYFQDYLRMVYTNEEDALKYWPDSIKEMFVEYQKMSSRMGKRIVQILMSHFGVTLDEYMFDAYMGEKDVTLNYYASYPEFQNAKVVGTRIHTDTSVLTILLQDHIGGLFLKLRYNEKWVEVPPTPGVLMVFIGDVLEVLSNGIYQGAKHYVNHSNGKQTRVSLPIFMNPRPTTQVRPLPQVVEMDGGKSRYKEFIFQEYNAYAYSTFYEDLRGQKDELSAIDSIKIVSP